MRHALILSLVACSVRAAPVVVDGGGADADTLNMSGADAYACVHVRLDAGGWGEACTTAQTSLCHDGLGWCIAGICRPQCVQPLACLACEGEAEHFSDAGQCYCAP